MSFLKITHLNTETFHIMLIFIMNKKQHPLKKDDINIESELRSNLTFQPLFYPTTSPPDRHDFGFDPNYI